MMRCSARSFSVAFCVLNGFVAQAQMPFLRGDANDDGRVSIADAYYIAQWLHGGGPPPPCVKAADANDDGLIRTSGAGGLSAGNDVRTIEISISCGDLEHPAVTGCLSHDGIAVPRDAPGEDPRRTGFRATRTRGGRGRSTIRQPSSKSSMRHARAAKTRSPSSSSACPTHGPSAGSGAPSTEWGCSPTPPGSRGV